MNAFSRRSHPASPLSYVPQLDAVRAFAVSLVLWHHWCGAPHHPFGPMGVWLFFVISGFLITRILLNARRESPRDNRTALFNFYVRRFLRIFPLYYFVLLLSFATSAAFREDWYWYAAYLQNFKMMWAADPVQVFGVHLWTLAVEEQFYVLWPLAVLFSPRAWLLPIIVSAVALAVASRCVCAAMGCTSFQVYVFTPNNLDTLALGALLAYVVTHRPHAVVLLRRVALAGGLAVWLATSLVRMPVWNAAFMPLPTGLIGFWLVSHVADGIHGWIGRLFSFPPSIYLGRISYGIYIYHFFVPAGLKPLLRRFDIEEGGVMFVAICFVVTVAIASLSFFLLENPINSLKHRFHIPARRWEANEPEAGIVTTK